MQNASAALHKEDEQNVNITGFPTLINYAGDTVTHTLN